MSDAIATEYLVIGEGEQTLARSEIEHQLLEVGVQGPPGPAFGEGDLDMDDHAILNAQVVGFRAERDNGDSGNFKQILLAYGQKQKVRVTANCVMEISGAGAPVGHYQLRIVQDLLGDRDVVFQGLEPTRWLNTDVVPEVHKDPSGESILTLFWDGTEFTQTLAKVGAL